MVYIIKMKRFIRSTIIHLVLLFLAILCLVFFFLLLINATKNKTELLGDFSLIPGTHASENLKSVLTYGDIPLLYGIFNSMIVAAGSAFIAVYSSVFAAYGLYMYHFRLRNFFFTVVMLFLVMPLQVCTLGFLRQMESIGLEDHLLALILPSMASPAVVFFLYSYMKSVLPKSYIESARMDGAGEFRIFNRIVLPLMSPAMAVQAIFSFVASWNNYFIPSLVIDTRRKMTLPVLIAMMRNADFIKKDMGKTYMMICISIFPVILVYLLLSRQIIEGVMQGATWNKQD